MVYLLPADYAEFGLSTETADAWITAASAMIDAHCRRPTLGTASYTERVRVSDRQTAFLTYGPLVSVDSLRARYAWRRPWLADEFAWSLQAIVAGAFGLPGSWVDLDPSTLDVNTGTGEIGLGCHVLALRYAEAEATYTAGLATIPDAVKVACAQIVRNAQATPGMNVKSSRMDTLQTEYFSDALLDQQVQAILRPYVAERLG